MGRRWSPDGRQFATTTAPVFWGMRGHKRNTTCVPKDEKVCYNSLMKWRDKEAYGMSDKIKVLMVCHGNICRSTMSQFVLQHMVNELGLEGLFEIDSRATSTEEIGNPPHRGTVRKMREVGIPVLPHRATQITWSDYVNSDYIIGMDTWNMRNLNRMLKGDPEGKCHKFLTFAGSDRDIADPWYTGDFDATYRDVAEGCEGFLRYLQEQGEL